MGKEYVSVGLFKLNVMVVKSKNNNAFFSTYILEFSNLLYGRLRHVNYNTLCKLINLNHMPIFQIDKKHKCESCVGQN